MSVTYRIDAQRSVITVTAQGVVTSSELIGAIEAVLREPEFRSDLRCLNDFSQVTDLIMTASELERLAERKTLISPSRRALIATQPLVFGMGRMYEAFVDIKSSGNVRVFTERAAALAWINEGVTPDETLA